MAANSDLLAQLGTLARSRVDLVVDLACRICEVPAPTGQETRRADLVAELLSEHGYWPEIDPIGNVYAHRGSKGGPLLMLAAHTDTVFPADTPLQIKRKRKTVHGPGIGDNSLGIAAGIGLLTILDSLTVETPCDLVFTANVGEEGLGNLRGVRAAVDAYEDRLGAMIAVEGHNVGRVTNVAVGSRRWRVRMRGPGGHSWGAYGQPSAIHELARSIARWTELKPPAVPRTTLNVGVIGGGTSVNTIAAEASAIVDMRSVHPDSLQELADEVERLAYIGHPDGIEVEIDVLGERPAGATDHRHPLTRAAMDALRQVGIEPCLDASSTDANVPIARGIPAVCIGITRGGRGHSVEEYIEVAPIQAGLTQLAVLTLQATAIVAQTSLELS